MNCLTCEGIVNLINYNLYGYITFCFNKIFLNIKHFFYNFH